MSRRILMALTALVFAGFAQHTASAQVTQSGSSAFTEHTSFSSPLDGQIGSMCTNEPINITGTEHVTEGVVQNDNQTRVMVHIVLQGQGTGAVSGAKYVLSQKEKQSVVDNATSTSGDFAFDVVLIGQGSAPNQVLHMVQSFSSDGMNYSLSTKQQSLTCN